MFERDLSRNSEAVSIDKGGHCAELGEGIHEFIFTREFDHWGFSLAGWHEADTAVGPLLVGVAAESKEIGGGFDGCKTGAWHFDCHRAIEALDSSTHRGFELPDRRGLLVARVDCLAVLNHRKREHSFRGIKGFLEGRKIEPEVIGVEKLMARDVLEVLEITLGTLRDFAEDESVIALTDREVAAFFIGFGPPSDLHREGCSAFGKPIEESGIESRSQVVTIGNKGIFDAVSEEAIQPAAADQGRVEVAMARRAPLMVGFAWPSNGLHGGGIDFRDFVLQHFHFLAVEGTTFESGQSVLAGGKRIHEQKAHLSPGIGAEGGNLLGDEIEEGFAVFHLKEAFCFLKAHAGAQATIELQHHSGSEDIGIPLRMFAGHGEVVRHVAGGLNRFLSDKAFLARTQEGESALKCSNSCFTEAGVRHFFTKKAEITHGRREIAGYGLGASLDRLEGGVGYAESRGESFAFPAFPAFGVCQLVADYKDCRPMSEDENAPKKVARKRVVKKGVRGSRTPRKKTIVKKEEGSAEASEASTEQISNEEGEVTYALGEGEATASQAPEPKAEIEVVEEKSEEAAEKKGDKSEKKDKPRKKDSKKGEERSKSDNKSDNNSEEDSASEDDDERGEGRNRRGRNRRGGNRDREDSGSKRAPVDKDEAAAKAWEIYQGELEEEGVSLVDPRRARDVARRCLELATIFCEERDRYLER